MLEAKGGPTKESEIFEELLDVENQISEYLGIVLTEEIINTLDDYAHNKVSVEEILLKSKNSCNKAVGVDSLLNKLKKMISEKTSLNDICEKLGCETHIYNFQILTLFEPEEALKELTNNKDFLNKYGQLWYVENRKIYNKDEIIKIHKSSMKNISYETGVYP